MDSKSEWIIRSIKNSDRYTEMLFQLEKPACKYPEFYRGWYACMRHVLRILNQDGLTEKKICDLENLTREELHELTGE